jgi:hypothetical protein
VVKGDPLHLGAGVAAAVRELQQRADLVEREAELASPADEAEASGLGLRVSMLQPVRLDRAPIPRGLDSGAIRPSRRKCLNL